MELKLNNRLQLTLLALITAGLIALAGMNFLQERQTQQPDDGIWWREAAGGLVADKVLPNSPGQRAGIRAGDLLTGIKQPPEGTAQNGDAPKNTLLNETGSPSDESDETADQPSAQLDSLNAKRELLSRAPSTPIQRVSDLEHALYRTGSYIKVDYIITRDGVSTPIELIPNRLIEACKWDSESSG